VVSSIDLKGLASQLAEKLGSQLSGQGATLLLGEKSRLCDRFVSGPDFSHVVKREK